MKKIEIPAGHRRCYQCNRIKPLEQGFRQGKRRYKVCNDCRREHARRTSGKHVENYRTGLPTEGELRVDFILASQNRKLGQIPASKTSAETCPPSCAWFNNGCFGEASFTRHWWRQVPKTGLQWRVFLEHIRALPAGQVWRHNTVGDLPGVGEEVYCEAVIELALANGESKGFTFTHKKRWTWDCWDPLSFYRYICDLGFTVNISCDSMEEVDLIMAQPDHPPTSVVLPEDFEGEYFTTPAGNKGIVCPAVTKHLTCEQCKLCTVADRKSVVGFPAHGNLKEAMTVQIRRKDGRPVQAAE